MKTHILCLVFTVVSITSYTQSTIIKTNTLNVLIIPSIHIEQKLTKRMSLVANFHRSKVIFITESNFINASLDLRYYLSKMKDDRRMRGFYLQPGFHIKRDLDEQVYNNNAGVVAIGQTYLGVIGRLGYQWHLSSRFMLDIGTGLAVHLQEVVEPSENFEPEPELRLMLGFGYMF
jgi:hypothetical protein